MVAFLFPKKKAAARMGSGLGWFIGRTWQRTHLAR
jgi:hypothetical protein